MNAFDPKRFTAGSDEPALSERPGCGPKVRVTSHFHAHSNTVYGVHARARAEGRVSCGNGMQEDTVHANDLTRHTDVTKTQTLNAM